MTQTILTFGDSNTHGTPPMHDHGFHPRLPRRWPVVMQGLTGCALIEDALPGRTACPFIASSPDMHLDGHIGLRIALTAHGPVDRLIIMLGTNDMKAAFGRSVDDVVAGLSGLLSLAHDPEAQARHGGFAVTLICPPVVLETGSFIPEFRGGHAKSLGLSAALRDLAAAWHCTFLDAGQHIAPSPIDGVHFDAATHEVLGKAIAATV